MAERKMPELERRGEKYDDTSTKNPLKWEWTEAEVEKDGEREKIGKHIWKVNVCGYAITAFCA